MAELKKNMRDILKDKAVSDAISLLQTLGNSLNTIYKSYKDAKPQVQGDWKTKLAACAIDQGIQLGINTVVNAAKLAEIPKIAIQINKLIKSNVESIGNKLESEPDLTHELTKDEENLIDLELNSFCDEATNRITSEIIGFLSGIVNGVFRLGLSLGTMAINEKIDSALQRKFERSNEKLERDTELLKTRNSVQKKESQEKANKKIENGEMNPKKSSKENINENESYEKEVKDKTREQNLADAQLKSNKDGRSIEVRDHTTGELIKIEPDSTWGKIKAAFKETAVVDFVKNEDGQGHFVTGYGQENFKETSGGNNCFLVAYEESFGNTVDQDKIQARRNSLNEYVEKNSEKYDAAKQKYKNEGLNHVKGGRCDVLLPRPVMTREPNKQSVTKTLKNHKPYKPSSVPASNSSNQSKPKNDSSTCLGLPAPNPTNDSSTCLGLPAPNPTNDSSTCLGLPTTNPTNDSSTYVGLPTTNPTNDSSTYVGLPNPKPITQQEPSKSGPEPTTNCSNAFFKFLEIDSTIQQNIRSKPNSFKFREFPSVLNCNEPILETLEDYDGTLDNKTRNCTEFSYGTQTNALGEVKSTVFKIF